MTDESLVGGKDPNPIEADELLGAAVKDAVKDVREGFAPKDLPDDYEVPLKTPSLEGLLPEPPPPKPRRSIRKLLRPLLWLTVPAVLVGVVAILPERELPDPPSGALVTLIERGSEWRYLDDGSNPGETWTTPAFDDSAWAVGNGLFGYGKGDETTVIRCRVGWPIGEPCPAGGEADRILTHYFRLTFEVESPADFERGRISLLKDDGAVVYLNGEAVIRANMGPGVVGFNEPAADESDHKRDWFDYHLDLRKLQPGANLIAVELHQSAPSGTDMGFDLSVVAFDQQARAVTRGPYLQMATPESVVVRWRTADRVRTGLRWGPAGDEPTVSTEEVLGRDHRVRLDGLEPGTDYVYTLGREGRQGAGTSYRFTTPSRDDAAPMTIWVVGDQGTGDGLARKVKLAFLDYLEHSGRTAPDVWLTLGDNAYDDGTEEEFRRALFDTYGDLLPRTVMWPSLGNHDLKSVKDGKGPYFDIFELPTEGESGGLASGTESYYSFDHGEVHFIALDTAAGDLRAGREMLTWLEKDLERNVLPWVVAYFHHPPYTDGWHQSDDPKKGWRMTAVRETVLPMLESAGVDVVLGGHSHSYERSFFLHRHYDVSTTLKDTMKLDPGDGDPAGDGPYTKRPDGPGTVYVVAGSSGKVATGKLEHPAMVKSFERLGSVVLEVRGRTLDGRFLSDDGEILDHFRIVHR